MRVVALLLALSLSQTAIAHKSRQAARPTKPHPPAQEVARRHDLILRGLLFRKIARGKAPGQHIVYRDKHVTAFLDRKDAKSPSYDAGIFDWEMESFPDLKTLPLERRAHVLVIPNRGRAHVGEFFGSGLRLHDLEASAEVVRAAERLAERLQIQRARVFINPADKVTVGYLHVHIIGERDPALPYPRVERDQSQPK